MKLPAAIATASVPAATVSTEREGGTPLSAFNDAPASRLGPRFSFLTRENAVLFVPLALALVLTLYLPVKWAWRTWSAPDAPLGYQPLIPLAAAYLAYDKRQDFLNVRHEIGIAFGRDSRELRGGLWLAFVGCALMLLAYATQTTGAAWAAFIVVVAGVVLAFFGVHLLSVARAPILLLLTMIPLPDTFIAGSTIRLQIGCTSAAGWLLGTLGIKNKILGNHLDIGNYRLEVSGGCSGLSILFPVLALTLWFLLLRKSRWGSGAILMVSAFGIALLMNTLRVAAMGLIGHYYDPKLAQTLHDANSWLFTLMALASVYPVARLLRITARPRSDALLLRIDESAPTVAPQDNTEEASQRNAGKETPS